jgi:hypothetical protein
MRRALRGCFGGLALGVCTLLLAQPAEAGKFEFNGADDDGMVVWDGAFDVATFNSVCGSVGACDTGLFSLVNFSPTLKMTINEPSFGDVDITGLQLTVTSLHVVAAIDIADFGLPSVTTACALPGATCFANLDALVAAFVNPSQDSGDLQELYTAATDATETQAYLAFAATPFSGTFPSGSTFGLDPAGVAFFNVLAADFPTARVGFHLGFVSLTGFATDLQQDVFVPFTLELTAGVVDSSIPEPSTWLLMLTGGAALAWRRRRART